MPLTDALQNGVSTLTGEVAKAIIRFKDNRPLNVGPSDKTEGTQLAATSGLRSPSSLAAFTPSIGGAILNKAMGVMGLSLGNKGYDKSITVQFNPSSIHLSGHAGDDDVQITNYTTTGKPGIGNGGMKLHVDMSVELIFDQTFNLAAFKQDLLSLNLTDYGSQMIGKAGEKIAKGLMGANTATVQQIVEAFIAIMRNEKCRFVCFEWGDLKYDGCLRTVNNEYTMFDMMGNPTRAKVKLTLYLVEAVGKKLMDYTDSYWYDAYYEAFIDGNPLAMAMAKMADLGVD